MKNMNQSGKRFSVGKLICTISSMLLIATLAACGGGGGAAAGSGSAGTTGSTGSSGTTTTGPVLSLALVDANATTITTLSGGDTGTINAKFVTAQGVALANALVTITGNTSLIQLIPPAGTALTDASGIAVIKLKPASFTAAGAFTLTAQAVSGTLTAAASLYVQVGAAPLTIGVLSFASAPANPLPALNTTVINIPVTSKGTPVTSVTGLSLTSLCLGDGKATLVQGGPTATTSVSVTYTNTGCTRGTDVITVSLGSSTQSISLAVSSANIGAIQFVGTDSGLFSLVLKGSGGAGRKESAIVTFKVLDALNQGLKGVEVNFSATTTTGGLKIEPLKATTDVDGNVSTTVSSGTIPTPVTVLATASQNGKIITGASGLLTISTGLPIQKFMSLSVNKYNFEGLEYDGQDIDVTVRMADQYGNPVTDGTAVNFVTEGGAIASSAQGACTTNNGTCSVKVISQSFKPANGRVTILAYAQGIENFVDLNGDGQYSCTDPVDNLVTNNPVSQANYRPLVDACRSGGEPFPDPADPQYANYRPVDLRTLGDLGDAFLDVGTTGPTSGVPIPGTPEGAASGSPFGTLDGAFNAVKGDLPFPYNHSGYSSAGDGKWGINFIRRTEEIIFSGSHVTLIRLNCDTSGNCVDWTGPTSSIIDRLAGASCISQRLDFRLIDVNNNPMPAGTILSSGDANKLTLLTLSPDTVLSSNSVGGTRHSVIVKADTACASGFVTIVVKTPLGNSRQFTFSSN